MNTSLAPSPGSRATGAAPPVSRETHDAARQAVRGLLERSEAFAALPEEKRRALAHDLVQIGSYLAEPDGVRVPPQRQSTQVRALAGATVDPSQAPEFGQAVRAGVDQMANLVEKVNFPAFVSGLIEGVFHSIVKSSIEQMEAYGKLVADVSKSLNAFRDDNTTQNQGRDHLLEQFPDIFQLSTEGDAFGGFGDFGGGGGGAPQPRVVLRDDVDEGPALERINRSLPLDKPLTSLDDELVEALLVPAARTQLATGRQQLLATMVMMGINRIVVTDGKISAKVLFDFKANDSRRFALSRMDMDYAKDAYGNVQKSRASEGSYDYSREGGTYSRSAEGNEDRRGSSYYAKGSYKYSEEPIVTLMSTQKLMDDSQLSTKASLTGAVEVNFKSDYLPLEKMASPENIAAIQMNAQPGMVKTLAGRPHPAPAATAPAASVAAPATAPTTPGGPAGTT